MNLPLVDAIQRELEFMLTTYSHTRLAEPETLPAIAKRIEELARHYLVPE